MKKIDRAAAAYKKNSKPEPSAEGFIKTSEADTTSSAGAGYSKAAKFLLLVGPEQAAEVLKHFSENDVEKIVREIASVRKINKKESADVLKEFGYLNRKAADENGSAFTAGPAGGGAEKALEMLHTAFGKEKGEAIFYKVLPFGGRMPFDFLNDLHSDQIMVLLKKEPPYVLSIVLSFLRPELSSKIISGLPAESRKEIVLRIARQGEIAPGVIDKMEGIFRERIRAQGKVVTDEIDGKTVLADILKYMDPGAEEQILEQITDTSTGLAEDIKNRIYTIDLILRLDDKDIQYLLRDFDTSELAIIIKGKPDTLKKRILDSVSERRRVMIEEESLHLGEMLRSDVDKATKEFVDYMMDLEQKGTIIIHRGEEEFI